MSLDLKRRLIAQLVESSRLLRNYIDNRAKGRGTTRAQWIVLFRLRQQEGLSQVATARHRVLFSAHGLPERVIKAGDPYQSQVEQTAKAIVHMIGGDLDWSVCYQSRVGPLKWIGPPTESEIRRAASDGKSVVLYPLSFVSEHSETLVELDIDYRHLAEQAGVPKYVRVPTVGTHPQFIHGLANLVQAALWSTRS